jgi:hypothetical protein
MGLALGAKRFREKSMTRLDTIVREVTLEFGDQLATEWTPLGNPELWKSPPPADYRPGNLQSSWFCSVGAPSSETTERTDIRQINHLDRLPKEAGSKVYFSNSAPHASAIENSHSSQAPVGIMWSASQFAPITAAIAARLP